MAESREGDLIRLLETEAQLESMLADVRRENDVRISHARGEAKTILAALEQDLPRLQASLREKVDTHFGTEIRSVEDQAAVDFDRFASVPDSVVAKLAAFVIERLLASSGTEDS